MVSEMLCLTPLPAYMCCSRRPYLPPGFPFAFATLCKISAYPARMRRLHSSPPQVSISPTSPKRGKPVTMKATGTLTKPLTSGSYSLAVKLGASEVYTHDGPLCGDSLAKVIQPSGTYTPTNYCCVVDTDVIRRTVSISFCFFFLFATPGCARFLVAF